MTAIGRALMSNPRLLLCDELSRLDWHRCFIRDIYTRLGAITAEGTALIIVEQDINRALDASARFYCLLEGRVALTAPCHGFDPSGAHPVPILGYDMSAIHWLQILIQGALLGGLYTLFAIGLSLFSFGIMRLVNIAHGDLIVLSAYVALMVIRCDRDAPHPRPWSSSCR